MYTVTAIDRFHCSKIVFTKWLLIGLAGGLGYIRARASSRCTYNSGTYT